MAASRVDEHPHFLSGRSLCSCNHGPHFGVWFSIIQTPRGVRITIGEGADGEARIVESDHPAAIEFIASLILQMQAVAA